MNRHLPLMGLFLMPLALATSCGGRESIPVGPATSPVTSQAEGRLEEGALLSSFDLDIDLVAASATLTPQRQATAIGDTYSELGLAPAFTEMFGRNFEVLGLRHSGSGDVEVDFRIRHPFAPAIRPDLAIFNVKAWVVTDQPATNIAGVATVPDLVTNAAGYGRMWLDTAANAPVVSAAPVQPYILLREDLGSDPFNYQQPAGFNVLFPGMTSDATLTLRLTPASQVRLRIYLTADYGQSAVRATRQNPQYELPKFAGNAPWKIAVTELANTLEAGNPTSSAEYQVEIWDWKHGFALGSDVASATLEIPGLTTGPLTLSLSGTGQDPSPLTATTFVANTSNAAEGEYWGLVTVTDQAAAGVGLLEDLRTPVTITSYTTYQCFPVQVAEGTPVGDPPVAVIARGCPGEAVAPGEIISLDGSGSLPGDSAIVDYEWDFDYDGSLFQIDASGALVSTSYPAETTKVIALRVRAADAQTDLATTLVTVLPTAGWGAPVRLTNTFSQKELFDTSQNTSNALSVGPDGRVHLTWFTQLPYQVWHQSFMPSPTPLIWDTPEMIYSSGGSGLGHVSCQTGPDNVTHVMYTLNAAGRPRQSVSKSGGTWSTPATVPASLHPGQWDRCLMIGNVAGTMGFLGQWSRGDQPPAGSGLPALPNDMYFSTLNAGVWSPLTRIGGADVVTSEGGGSRVPSHALVGTAAGEWLAVWESLYTPFPGGPTGVPSLCKLIWSQTTSGAWPAEGTDLYNDGPDYDLPILARSPNGRVWLGARIGTQDAWGLVTYEGGIWSPSFTQIFSPTGVTFSRLPCTQFSFDALGRGCLLVSYREPAAPVQAKFILQDDALPTIAACSQQVLEPGLTGVGKPMCQIAAHGDGRYTAIWLTTKYNPGNPYFENTEIEYATWE